MIRVPVGWWLPALLVLAACAEPPPEGDTEAVTALFDAYRDAWLRDAEDVPESVLALFAEDAALLPHHGDPIVTGRDAIADYWFPDGKMIGNVERFDFELAAVEAGPELAYLYGRFRLDFALDGMLTVTEGSELMVARRDDREWKIVAMIWTDPPVR